MEMILNKEQAEAVYSALCALNNVGGEFDRIEFPSGKVAVGRYAYSAGLYVSTQGKIAESYANQAAFAEAYGLNE